MHIITTISGDELRVQLSEASAVETIDMGAVSLHLVSDGRTSHLLLENPANDDQSMLITFPA